MTERIHVPMQVSMHESGIQHEYDDAGNHRLVLFGANFKQESPWVPYDSIARVKKTEVFEVLGFTAFWTGEEHVYIACKVKRA